MKAMTFGEYLRAAMRAAGYGSNVALSRATGISESAISKWRSDLALPEIPMLRTLAEHLSQPVLDLLVAAGYITWQEAGRDAPLEAPHSVGDFENRIANLAMSDEAREIVLREFERMQALQESGRRTSRRGREDEGDSRKSA